ncbi:MAG: heavy-metal-associated domain-containing protein [Desulfomonile tiedjei]|nr:heavy-metal-associated domain-containing protein [Desulfomonile tiedjei]
MSEQRRMKEINLENLEQADRKISFAKFRSAAIAAVILLCVAGGGYAAYTIVSGDIVASRFAVSQMTCPACVVTVKEVTEKIPGVVNADVSLAAQDVIVKFRNKQTSPDQIKQAIAYAGYPVHGDGMFKPSGEGIDDKIVAEVNGKPIFAKDVGLPMNETAGGKADGAASFFSTVGRAILLQEADRKTVVVQPFEVETEVNAIIEKSGKSSDEFMAQMTATFGSKDKYLQLVGQRLGVRKLLEDHVLANVKEPQERNHKTLEWVGGIFKDSDVKILDAGTKEVVRTATGQDDWKLFWPRMIAGESDLKSVIMQ